VLQPRWLVWVGKRSYGLYLWHYLWATWTHPLPSLYGMPLGVAGAVVCTVISWRLVEAPCLRYAMRFRPASSVRRTELPATHGAFRPAREARAASLAG
jgi:peptidoglycan/LPS O-acetylase OafA/YrhL